MKYPSKYSNGKSVTPAQFITEIVCERLAKKNKKDLHYRFWLSKEWEKQYKGQIGTANKLLKKYEPKDIIDTLCSREGLKIYSLRAPHLCGMIDEQITNKSKRPKVSTKVIERNFDSKGQINGRNKKNIIDILEEIDNGISEGQH